MFLCSPSGVWWKETLYEKRQLWECRPANAKNMVRDSRETVPGSSKDIPWMFSFGSLLIIGESLKLWLWPVFKHEQSSYE